MSSGLSLQPGHSHVVRVPSLRHGIHPALRAAMRAARSPDQVHACSAVGRAVSSDAGISSSVRCGMQLSHPLHDPSHWTRKTERMLTSHTRIRFRPG